MGLNHDRNGRDNSHSRNPNSTGYGNAVANRTARNTPSQAKVNPYPVQKAAKAEEELQMKKTSEEEQLQLKAAPVQQKSKEEEELQMKKAPVQKVTKPGEEELQMKKSSEEKEVQMKEAPVQKKGSGSGMPTEVQAKMENSFGADFSDINIHSNSDSATQMGALAYAQGNDVHFAPGQYNPDSQKGQELLGHELTHVVQQRQGRVQATTQAKGVAINDDKGLEKEADVMGVKAARGESTGLTDTSAVNTNALQMKSGGQGGGPGKGTSESKKSSDTQGSTVPSFATYFNQQNKEDSPLLPLVNNNQSSLGSNKGGGASNIATTSFADYFNQQQGKGKEKDSLLPLGNRKLSSDVSSQIANKGEQAAKNSSNPILGLMEVLMTKMGAYLGPFMGSKLTADFKIDIPIPNAPGLNLSLGLGTEQERKDDKNLVANKLQGTVGITGEIPGIEGEGSASFSTFLGAESSSFGTSAELISYGFYKSGRVAADLMNDWGGAAAGLLPSSVLIYHGLNYMYSDGNKGHLAKAQDVAGAEKNVAAMEAKLFGIGPNGKFDGKNKNEASYGAAAKLAAKAGDKEKQGAEISGELEGALTTKITQDSLKNSGIVGAQKDAGFWKDYKVGGQKEFAMKLAGKLDTKMASGSKEMVVTFIEGEKEVKDRRGIAKKERGWIFDKVEFEAAYALGNIIKLSMTEKEIIHQLGQQIIRTIKQYNNDQELTKKEDNKAKIYRVEEPDEKEIKDRISMRINGAFIHDVAKSTSKVKTSDQIQTKVKVTAVAGKKPEVLFQIGRVTVATVDLKVFEGEVVDFRSLISFAI